MTVTGLLGPNGKPISSKDFGNKKVKPPATGEKYGQWSGPDIQFFQLPGGGIMQFDLNQLTLSDFRQMRDHYQINSSLTVLMFLMHQMEWRVECENKKQQEFYTEQLEGIWTPLVRSLSQAFWAGYSPNVLQWENDTPARRVTITKVKDLVPEMSHVNWKKVDGAGTHKISIYDGIKQDNGKEIPVDNTFWYPLLAENGNYEGKKLLRSAFQPWFFSMLVHLFANRYYERFGEPTPIGRAPYDDDVRFQGKEMQGNQAMELILGQLRNRAAVVLPADKTQYGDETTLDYDYQIEYLESTMRGADFERYMTRLDEEMSLALFTPILLMRTADVGSYNLGTQHSIIYQWMLNALSGDWKYYIDWYLLRPLRNWNFGTNADLPKIKFRRMGDARAELVNNTIASLISKGTIKFNYDELGEIAGLSLEEVKVLTEDPEVPGGDPDPAPPAPAKDSVTVPTGGAPRDRVYGVVQQLKNRIAGQIPGAQRNPANTHVDLGFNRALAEAFENFGASDGAREVGELYPKISNFIAKTVNRESLDAQMMTDIISGYIDNHVELILLRNWSY